MAAFSYQHHHPFLLDSVFLPNTPIKVSDFMEEASFNQSFFSQFYTPSPPPPPTKPLLHHPEIISSSSKVALSLSDNEPCSTVTKKQSTESSTVVDKLESGEQVTQTVNQMDKKRKNRNGSTSNSTLSKDGREVMKSKKQKKINIDIQKDEEKNKPNKADKKVVDQEEPPTGYIHVRARRGQATDSHSLAERVRREKISERMKILQKLVPGCDKVTGKALMLDEIINYVQSLQNQVEFLSMKLASVNPMFYDFGMDFETLMVRPERLNGMAQCNPNPTQHQPTAFGGTTTATTFPTPADHHYTGLDTAALTSYLLQRDAFSQENSSLLWEMEDQKQKFTGFSNNLYSFH
ncbi:hypothetical protein LWI29_036430 [Acer saccharum]|uniref:BHLH domain-containing protein n=1 Tax=Acer saccharum TaxID=4024 RepID=A0AA39SGB4_ACESA|nr:hypothetical protein LWI29_036430 [Acer saccharum]